MTEHDIQIARLDQDVAELLLWEANLPPFDFNDGVFSQEGEMFDRLRRKNSSDLECFDFLDCSLSHARVLWDAVDAGERALLLRNFVQIADRKVFSGYVMSPFSDLPSTIQLTLRTAITIYEETPGLLDL